MAEQLDHRQDDADERGQPRSGHLPERSDGQHPEMAPAQGHRVHIHRLSGRRAGRFAGLVPCVPAFEQPDQRDADPDAHDRFEEAQQAVFRRGDVGRHLRDEQDDQQRDGGDAIVFVDTEQHAEHLQREDRSEHSHDREGPDLEVDVGDERPEQGPEDPDPSGTQRVPVALRLQDDHDRRAGQHGSKPARRFVQRPRHVDSREVGQQDADAGDERNGRVHASDGFVQMPPNP